MGGQPLGYLRTLELCQREIYPPYSPKTKGVLNAFRHLVSCLLFHHFVCLLIIWVTHFERPIQSMVVKRFNTSCPRWNGVRNAALLTVVPRCRGVDGYPYAARKAR